MGGSGEEEAVGDGFGSGAAASAALEEPSFGLVEWPLVNGDELRPFFDLPIAKRHGRVPPQQIGLGARAFPSRQTRGHIRYPWYHMRTAAKQPVDAMPSAPADASLPTATKWDLHELELLDDASSLPDNPFDVELFAVFTLDGGASKPVQVRGFHDGGATFRVRFMPPRPGVWRYETRSDRPALSNRRGGLRVAAATTAGASPVRVHDNGRSFVHADGSAHFSVGTTSYAWIHQGDATIRHTIQTLRDGPFNKLRMTLLPKWYQYNHVEPRHFPH